ncbi:sarcosine oxidase subunit gamma [Saccharopolyspora gloriosae]|uniref:sarcosine oxidase subunit gamma n=1 Tax=Saccharopolyspora gloriosae TaxID=455344 RepID=UPI001FB8149C|nr:sarcosine oxidase subunit gamma family protein [Saccharopolyspora gloriosae]
MTVTSPAEPGTTGPATADLRRSPLAARHAELAEHSARSGVLLAEESFLAQVNLRATPDALDRVGRTTGIPLPRNVNEVHGTPERAVLGLAPDEWLIIAPDGTADGIVAELAAAGAGSAVDVSANRTTLRLAGPRARDVLEQICSLDLHPRAFTTGSCAQTLVGRTQAILWQLTEEPAYRLLVRGSFATYLADLLIDALPR